MVSGSKFDQVGTLGNKKFTIFLLIVENISKKFNEDMNISTTLVSDKTYTEFIKILENTNIIIKHKPTL